MPLMRNRDDRRDGEDERAEADRSIAPGIGRAWVAALVDLSGSQGKILDIGCGDGSLLDQLRPGWERYGIEANAELAAAAAGRGVDVVANDLLDPIVRERLAGRLQVITVEGVPERLSDIRLGVAAAVDLLSTDGILLFELPLAHGGTPDHAWLAPVSDRARHPTKVAIERWMVDELSLHLTGTVCAVRGGSPKYVGIVTRHPERAATTRDLVERVLVGPIADLHTADERRARALFQVIYAGDSSGDALKLLPALRTSDASVDLYQRLVSLWLGDLPRHVDGGEQVRGTDQLAALIANANEAALVRHHELRREKARLERLAIERHEALRAEHETLRAEHEVLGSQVAHSEALALARHDALRTDIARSLTRLERLQRDSIAHRTARHGRGAIILLRSFGHRADARNVLLGARLLIDTDARRTWSQLFSADEYLDAHADVVKANVPATLHYLLLGYREGREPSKHFSGESYLRGNPDLPNPEMNPLAHYALEGRRQGRPSGDFPAALPAESRHDTGSVAASGDDGGRSRTAAPDVEPRVATRINTSWPDRFPLVSVVIPSFNYGQSLRASVESVLAQTWEDSEIIVVESDSTDPASAAAIRELEAERPARTTFLYREGRRLVGDNRNFGIDHARGRYVVCLDADDTLEPVYIEVALFLAEAYQYDLVYPSVQCVGGADTVWPVRDTTFGEMLERNSVSTAALLRRSAWLEAGGYQDWGIGDTLVPEDWAFWTRLIGMGCRPKAIAQPLLRHLVHDRSSLEMAWTSYPTWRASIRAANVDLIDKSADSESEPAELRVVGPFRNLLAREPSIAAGGSVLIATSGHLDDQQWSIESLGNGLSADGTRVIVAMTQANPETRHHASSLRTVSDHVYELPLLFGERSRQEAFLLYLLQRYRVRTLVMAGSGFTYELLDQIRQRRSDVGIIDLLSDLPAEMDGYLQLTPLIDVAIVASAELKARLTDGAGVSSDVFVIPATAEGTEVGPMRVYRQCREAFARAAALAAERPPRVTLA